MKTQIETNERRISDPMWFLSCVLITITAAFLRFFWLALKPLHHDEGVNGWFLTTLFEKGEYRYDPANYHGPTLYYISLGFAKVFGLETVSIRASMAIWGLLIVVLAFFLRRYIGTIGSLFAALFLALSPAMVYISRYFIHEIFFVFLSFAIVMAIVFFIEKRKAGRFAIAWTALILLVCFLPSALKFASVLGGTNEGAVWAFRAGFVIIELVLVILVIRMLLSWDNGRPLYFLLAIACVSLMFATKETAFITLGTMLIACGCIWAWRRIFKIEDTPVDDEITDAHLTWRNFLEAAGTRTDLTLLAVASAVVFIFIGVLFFSSFFTYGEGVNAAIEAYKLWTRTGTKDHTQNGTWAYVEWLMQTEAPIVILSAIGGLVAFVKARQRFAMFVALWAFGLFAAYTIIPYKTPWLAISFLLPMCIVAGYTINELATARNSSLNVLGALLAVAASGVLAYQTYNLNFVQYDNEDQAMIYAHTSREFHDLMDRIEYYAEKSGQGKAAKIEIVSPDYWPMVWYLRDYDQANFHGQLINTDNAEMIVAKKRDQDSEVIKRFSARYLLVGEYHLRSGVDLVLLVRKDLADSDARELYRLIEVQP